MGLTKVDIAPGRTGRHGGRPDSGAPDARRLWSFLLAAVIFTVDSLAPIEFAVSVLYVIVLLLAAGALSRRGIVLVALACAGLSMVSFAAVHGPADGWPPALRCTVALAAIAITAGLLLREQASRRLLVETNGVLHRSERRYRSLFEQVHFSLWEQDFTKVRDALEELRRGGVTDIAAHARSEPGFAHRIIGRIETIDVNDATVALLGAASRAEVLGPVQRFIPPDDTVALAILQALFEKRDHFEGKASIIGVDGRELTVLLGITFPDDGTGFDQVAVAVVDITQRERTQEALLAAQSELARASRVATVGVLSASIAHELNQPLGALLMNAQTCLRWLRRDPPDLGAATKAAERTVDDGRRAAEIVKRTRGMLLKGERRMEPVDPRAMVEDAGRLLEREFAADGATLTVDAADALHAVLANRSEMRQVLINLMTNALHAMRSVDPGQRTVAIGFDRPEPTSVRITVRDHGTGIPTEHLDRLFDPFFTTRADGMGMGLAICRSIVEAHGGRLQARNHDGGGAALDVVLPIHTERG